MNALVLFNPQATGPCVHSTRTWVQALNPTAPQEIVLFELVEDSSLSREEKDAVRSLYSPAGALQLPNAERALNRFANFPTEVWQLAFPYMLPKRVIDITLLINPLQEGNTIGSRTIVRPLPRFTASTVCKDMKAEAARLGSRPVAVARRMPPNPGQLSTTSAWTYNNSNRFFQIPLGHITPADILVYRQGEHIALNNVAPNRFREEWAYWTVASDDPTVNGRLLSLSSLKCHSAAADWQRILRVLNPGRRISSSPFGVERVRLEAEWGFLAQLSGLQTLYILFSEEIRISFPVRESLGTSNFTPIPGLSPVQTVVDLDDDERIGNLVSLDEPTRPGVSRVSTAANTNLGMCIGCRRQRWQTGLKDYVQYLWLLMNSHWLTHDVRQAVFEDENFLYYNPHHPWVVGVLARAPRIRPGLLFSFHPRQLGAPDLYHQQMLGILPVETTG